MPDFSAITAAAAALNVLTAAEQAEKARIDAAVQAALQATLGIGKTIYLDQVAGLDANDGSTPQLAVASFAKAASLVGPGQVSFIILMSDVTLTAPVSLQGGFVNVASYGTVYGGVFGAGGGVARTLTLAPASGVSPVAGQQGVPLLMDRRTALYLLNMNLAVGALASAASPCALAPSGYLGMLNVGISLDPGLQVPVIKPVTPTDVLMANVSLPAGYGGKLFANVAAGANPNSFMLRTNITAG